MNENEDNDIKEREGRGGLCYVSSYVLFCI